MKKFLEDDRGESNLISLIILLVLVIIAVLLFKPYIIKIISWIWSVFM